MKIALLTPTFCQFSGIDRVVELDAKNLFEKGNEVVIVTFKSTIKTKYAKIITIGMPKNSLFERIYRLFFFIDFLKIKKVSYILKEYDIIISHFYPMNLIASYTKKKYGLKYICRYYGVAPPCLFNNLIEKSYMWIFNKLSLISMVNADEVLSISKYLSRVLYNQSQIKSKVEYVPINKKIYNKNVKILPKIKRKYKNIKGPILLYVGRISPHKGIDLLIKMFNLLLEKEPNAYLIIIGKITFKEYYHKLKKMVKKNIEFAGFIGDKYIPSYYKLSDVYTTCTLWEGYDMPVVEAQACKTPVVCFDIGPHNEVVKNGFVVNPKDLKLFVSKILELI